MNMEDAVSSWHPIIVGVDGSPESACAAAFGADIARRAGVPCRLVHAIDDYAASLSVPDVAVDLEALKEAAESSARRLVDLSLGGQVSLGMRRALEVKSGRPAVVLADLARSAAADAVILGAKHRDRLARLAGSTVNNLLRLSAVPVLATECPAPQAITRVLAAVDLSEASRPTIEAAERWAMLYSARLRVMHASEPVPVIPGFYQSMNRDEFFRSVQRQAETIISPLLTREAEIVVRPGRAAAAIASEAKQWGADLIVVGSHGKGWVDRLLIGSTSERLLDILPATVLVIPTAAMGAANHPVQLSV